MGQTDDKGFIIKKDGTIVRGSKSSKVNQMKDKLSSGGNNNGGGDNPIRWLVFFLIAIVGGIIFFNIVSKDKKEYSFIKEEKLETPIIENVAEEQDSGFSEEEEFETKRITMKTGSMENPPSLDFMFDYPVKGKPKLVSSIREWINNTWDDCVDGRGCNSGLEDGEKVVKYYFDDAKTITNNVMTVVFKREYETKSLISYQFSIYKYKIGWAHGSSFDGGATFNKNEGHIIDWGSFVNNDDMQKLIKDGLMEYYEDNSEHFKDFENAYFSFPEGSPILLSNGVKFAYGTYEIPNTSYADGQPQFTIPYDKIKDLMSSSLRELIE